MMSEELKPCPFCDDAMEISSGDVLRHIHQGDCIIGKQAWGATQNYLEAWNTRPADQQAAMIAELRGLLKDVFEDNYEVESLYWINSVADILAKTAPKGESDAR